jgi:hypothetical protein
MSHKGAALVQKQGLTLVCNLHDISCSPFLESVMKRTAVLMGLALAVAATGAQAEDVSGSFVSSTSTYLTGFASDAGLLTGSVMSSFTGKAGYDIYKVLVDGVSVPDLLPGLNDYYDFSAPVLGGFHTIAVFGKSYGGSFVGSYEVSSVPEPESLALALAGLGIVASVTRRRLR